MCSSNPINYCNLFNEDKQEELYKFLHHCIDEICNYTTISFQQFVHVEWTKEEFDSVYKLISTLLNNPSCLYIDEEKMPLEYSELPQHVQQAILTCLKIRKNQLTNALVYKYSSKQIPTLIEFDWRLKYIMGSSKMASIREPLLQLDFILKGKRKDEILELELDMDELDLIIHTLDNIIN